MIADFDKVVLPSNPSGPNRIRSFPLERESRAGRGLSETRSGDYFRRDYFARDEGDASPAGYLDRARDARPDDEPARHRVPRVCGPNLNLSKPTNTAPGRVESSAACSPSSRLIGERGVFLRGNPRTRRTISVSYPDVYFHRINLPDGAIRNGVSSGTRRCVLERASECLRRARCPTRDKQTVIPEFVNWNPILKFPRPALIRRLKF